MWASSAGVTLGHELFIIPGCRLLQNSHKLVVVCASVSRPTRTRLSILGS